MVVLAACMLLADARLLAQGGNPPKPAGNQKEDPKPAPPPPKNGGAPPADNKPADPPKADPAKADPPKPVDFAQYWDRVKDFFMKGKVEDKYREVMKIVALNPGPGIAELIVKANNGCRGYADLQRELAKKLQTLDAASDPESTTWCMRVFTEEAKLDKNASSELIGMYGACLFKANLAEAPQMVENILPKLAGPAFVFSMLFDTGRKDAIEIVARFAISKSKDVSAVLKRQAVEYLGKWWNGPPIYQARIPALLEAMASQETAEEAKSSLESICLPKFQSASRWKKWWDANKDWDDRKIIWESMLDAFVRVVGGAKKIEGAAEIIEFIKDWKRPDFAWAVPILHDALLQFDNKDLRVEILYNLGLIKNAGSLEYVLKLLELPSSSNPELQAPIAKCIGLIAPENDETAGATLDRILANTMTETVQIEVVTAWGKMRFQKAVPAIIQFLKDPIGGRKAWAAARALGEMKATQSLKDLIEVFGVTTDRELKLHITSALIDLKAKTQEVFQIGIIGLDSDDERQIDAALGLLKFQGDPRCVTNVREIFKDDKRGKVTRLKALETVSVFAPEHSLEAMVDALKYRTKEEDKELEKDKFRKPNTLNEYNAAAAAYFEKDGGANLTKDVLDPLLNLVGNRKNNGRLKMVNYISHQRIWDKKAFSVLMDLLHKDENEAIVLRVREVLIERRHKDFFEPLAKQLSGGRQGQEWIDHTISYIIRTYVEKSNMVDDTGMGVDLGTDKKAWLDWWSKNKAKFEFVKEEDSK